jgi:hypothetical protein
LQQAFLAQKNLKSFNPALPAERQLLPFPLWD